MLRIAFSRTLEGLAVFPNRNHELCKASDTCPRSKRLDYVCTCGGDRERHRRCTAILQGLGGIGETQLTVAHMKQYHSQYTAAMWLNAEDFTSPQQSFACIALQTP